MKDYYDRQFDKENYNDPDNRPANRRYQDSGYNSHSGYNSQRDRYPPDEYPERSWWERAGDEVLTWLGDDYATKRRRHDAHRGKGPKNYVRDDERIKDDINDRLTDEYTVDATDIEVNVSSGEVILTGYVSDRWQKRRAEDVAEMVSGVKNVENRLKVDPYVPKDNVNLIP